MCRFFAYSGAPVLLHDMLIAPEASLLRQSAAAREAKTVVNGDGCGLGWYGEFAKPGVFRDTRPAWSDANFAALCEQIRSRMFMAHVRSATSGDVSRANTHPFASGRHLFMHNGQIGGYEKIRRKLDAHIPDHLFAARDGTGDSQAIFLVALGMGLEADPVGSLKRTLTLCCRLMDEAGVTQPLRFSAALCDGRQMHAFRWSTDSRPPSLYLRELAGGVAISSEPFSFDTGPWQAVPANSVIRIADGNTEISHFDVDHHLGP